MSRIMRARYRFLADVYGETAERDRSGQYVRTWDLDNPVTTIKGSARGILGGGIRVVGSTETFGEDYEDVEWVKFRVGHLGVLEGYNPFITEEVLEGEELLNRSYRVGNIRRDPAQLRRGQTETILWRDEEGNPQLFNIVGIQPVFDPFDQSTEHDLLLKGVTGD